MNLYILYYTLWQILNHKIMKKYKLYDILEKVFKYESNY